ncbi:hypothetical protein GNY06_05765 [Elizabethkingia argentiflava]|uniref:GNAT family N-acetyltransferase n=1 Tax=Elizabethkingia argenteiflava TaxID=2681556 RepID=A0A845PRK4_9FLAO|nr:hypothetical protein [Elizabethkingia argenteiflava]NAW50899.1 hypothetical protein [Elizabethkingia argenteiflava]
MRSINMRDYPRIEEILTNAFKENKSVNYMLRKKDESLISKLMSYSIFKGENSGYICMNEEETACVICVDLKKIDYDIRVF